MKKQIKWDLDPKIESSVRFMVLYAALTKWTEKKPEYAWYPTYIEYWKIDALQIHWHVFYHKF